MNCQCNLLPSKVDSRAAAAISGWLGILLLMVAVGQLGCQGSKANEEKTTKSDEKANHVTSDLKTQPNADSRVNENDWPCFLGNSQDGISAEVGILTDWSANKLPLLWSRDLGEGYAPGVVAKGKYFHFDRIEDEARLICLEARTGEELWEFKYSCTYRDMYGYDGGSRASPTVDGDRVYVYGPSGMLYSINVADGEEVWTVDTAKRFGVHQNFFGVGSPPVIFKDKVLVVVGGSPEDNEIKPGQLDQALPNSTAIVAFDKATGEQIYALGDDLASYSAIRLTHLDEKDWAFAWCRNNLIAFDPNNGEIQFTFPWKARPFESVNASTPVVVGNQVFLSECYGKGSVLLEFGDKIPDKHNVIWKDEGREQALRTHWNTPILFDGHLFASSGRNLNEATLRCVELATGEVKWSRPGLGRCNLTLVDDHLIVVGEQGGMILVRPNVEKFDLVTVYKSEDETFQWKNPCWAAPVIANRLIYVRSKDQVACFELIPSPDESSKEN